MMEWGQGPSSPPPRSPFAHRPTSSSCASAPWESVLRKPDYQTQAVEQFRQASQLNAKSAPDRLNYALALLRAGNAKEGVGELEAVQKMDPKLPHTWFNLGIEYKKMGETDKAIAQLEQMARLVADEPITQYNLGVLYKAAGRAPDANAKFALSARLDPNFAAPHFQLFNFYRQQGQADRAKEELGRFQDLKSATKRPAPATRRRMVPLFRSLRLHRSQLAADTRPATALKFLASTLPGKFAPANTTLHIIDLDGSGSTDLLVVSTNTIHVFRKGLTPVPQPGFAGLTGILGAVPGDYDNDGLWIFASSPPPDRCCSRTARPGSTGGQHPVAR